MDRIGTPLSVLLALAGCGSGPIGMDDEVGDSVGDTTDGSTDGSTDDSTEDDVDGDTETDTGTTECPPRETVTARFRVTPSTPIQATCYLVSEDYNSLNHYEMLLDCEGTD